MNLEDLRAAQTRERATDGLQELRDSFYGDVAEYIAELKDRRDAAASATSDPFGDPEVQDLTDKIETAEQVAEAIYERRMGKLVKQASLAAAGMPDDPDGLTEEERELYADLVDRIEANKGHVLDVISGDADDEHGVGVRSGDDAASVENPEATATGDGEADDASAAAAMGGGLEANGAASESPDEEATPATDDVPEPDASSESREPTDAIADDLAEVRDDDTEDEPGRDAAAGSATTSQARDDDSSNSAEPDGGGDDVDRTMVRVTDDVGEIFGLDEREYTLEAEDVVTLPTENAEPLVEKGAAEKLD